MSVIIHYLMRIITHKMSNPSELSSSLTSCHDYALSSSADDNECRSVYNNSPKILNKLIYENHLQSLVVSVAFPEATGRLSHDVGWKSKRQLLCEDRSSSGSLALYNVWHLQKPVGLQDIGFNGNASSIEATVRNNRLATWALIEKRAASGSPCWTWFTQLNMIGYDPGYKRTSPSL